MQCAGLANGGCLGADSQGRDRALGDANGSRRSSSPRRCTNRGGPRGVMPASAVPGGFGGSAGRTGVDTGERPHPGRAGASRPQSASCPRAGFSTSTGSTSPPPIFTPVLRRSPPKGQPGYGSSMGVPYGQRPPACPATSCQLLFGQFAQSDGHPADSGRAAEIAGPSRSSSPHDSAERP